MQIWFQNAKITIWKNFKQFFQFHRFRSSARRLWNKVISQYKLFFKMYVIYIDFHHQVSETMSFSILAVLQNVCDLHKFGLQIWIQNAKITLWKNFGQFFWFHRFWSSGPPMRNKVISQYLLYFKMYGI